MNRLFSFIFLLFCAANAWASHIVAGDLYYDCANSQIVYTEYSDCSGLLPPTTLMVTVEGLGACVGQNTMVTLNQVSSWDITPICPGITTQCNGGTAYGVRETKFVGNISLTFLPGCNARVVYSNCCRNASVINLVNASNSNFFVMTDSLSVNGCNSTPKFLNEPVMALSAGQNMTFSQAATEADGDVLVYSLGSNLSAVGTSIPYNLGYSSAAPMGANWNVSINANTGQMSFTSTGTNTIGNYALAINVDEYRNGVHIGRTVRDMQVMVTNSSSNNYNCCHVDYNFTQSSNLVSFSAITATSSIVSSYAWSFGDGGTSTLANPIHTYTNAGSYQATLVVNYTSGCSDSATYIINIQAPAPSTLNADFSANTTNNSTYTFQDLSTSNYAITSWSWDFGVGGATSTLQNPSYTFMAPGTYNVCLTTTDASGATDMQCMAITIYPSPVASFTYSNVNANTVQLTNTTTGGTAPYIYTWSVTPNTSASINNPFAGNPTMTFTSSGTYSVCLYITDINGMSDNTCQSVVINIPPACDPLFSFATNGMSADFTPSNFSSATTYTINYGDGSPTASAGPVSAPPIFSHTYTTNGVYTACMTATNGTCVQDTCFNVAINVGVDIDGYIYSAAAVGTPDSFIVYLIEYTNAGGGTLTKVDSQYVNGNPAYYNFANVNSATMIFHTKAAMTSNSPNYASYIPTYHDSSLVWASSTAICIPCAPPLPATFDIYMQAGVNPGGPGFIGGLISLGANKTGDPAQKIEVMLWDMNDNPITYTYTDMNGNFGISNLAYGTYKVYPEVIGLVTEPYIVTIDGTNPSFNGVDMTMGDSLIAPTVVGVEMPNLPAAVIYPNPTTDAFTFQAELAHTGMIHIEMYNAMGQKVYAFEEVTNMGKYTHKVSVENMAAGVYTLKIVAENNGTQNTKVIVSR